MAGYWIDPKGQTFDIPHFMHETFARSRGARNISELIRLGWIRALIHDGAFNFQLSSYSDESTLERIEDFLAEHTPKYERWAVTLETENPLEPPVHLMDRHIKSSSLKEVVAHEVKMHRLGPFGMTGLDEEEVEIEFYGEVSSCVRTPDGIQCQKERYWYDPESDDIICERVLE